MPAPSLLARFFPRAVRADVKSRVEERSEAAFSFARSLLATPASEADGVVSRVSMASGSGAALVEGSSVGRYTITRLIGEGGMGAVYEAEHRELGKRVAIKVLHAHHAATSDVRARFVREGQAASRIRHPNVVDVYDVAVEGDMPYLVMEFLEGEDVAKLVAREGALPVGRAVDLLLPVVSAVAAANELGVVHRDLKPENVFLCWERGVVRPRVVDFGISKLVDRDGTSVRTATDAFLGTPFYMSPEQAQGARNVDARSDQYSLGVILYECVTGRRPFEDPTLYKLMHKIVTGDFLAPRAIVPALPQAFEAIILKAMAKDAADRFESTRAFGAALLPFAGERTRAVVGDDFSEAIEPNAASPRTGNAAAAAANTDDARASTLGRSVHQLETRGGGTRRRTYFTLGGALAAAAATVWFTAQTSQPGVPRTSSAPSTAPVAPSQLATSGPPPSSPPSPPSIERKRVESVPPGVTLRVNGVDAGVTPQTLEVPPGGLPIELAREGYESLSRTLGPSDPANVVLTLVPRPLKSASPKPAAEHASKSPQPSIPKLAPR